MKAYKITPASQGTPSDTVSSPDVAGVSCFSMRKPNNTDEILCLPTREHVRVFIEDGWVKVLQMDSNGQDQVIQLDSRDAKMVADALRKGSIEIKKAGYL